MCDQTFCEKGAKFCEKGAKFCEKGANFVKKAPILWKRRQFCEKGAKFCPNIAQNGALLDKNFCPKKFLVEIF
jgi:hypothetical protein